MRSALRLVMVLLAAGVGLLVYVQWDPDAGAGAEAEDRPELGLPESEREIESVSHALSVSQAGIGGQERMRIEAERQLDYVDGWNIWENARVWIRGREPDRTDDDVYVVGDTMRTSGEVGDFSEVRFIGNVRAELPGEAAFETRRVDYDAVTGVASNCNRNLLTYVGLQVGSDCLEFQTAGDAGERESLRAEELRMWGNLTLEASEAESGRLPEGLRGTAAEMRFRPGGEDVTLEGEPVLRFGSTTIQGTTLRLDVGSGARELRHVRAAGQAVVRMGLDEAGDGDGAPTVLAGEEIGITFGDGTESDSVVATGARPSLRLPGRGSLTAARIELAPGSGRIEAAGEAVWEGEPGVAGPERLEASELDLTVTEAGLEELSATGGVRTRIDTGQGAAWSFSGPALEMEWEGESVAPARAAWPEGVELERDGRSLVAGEATLADGDWVLSGTPRPAISGPEIELAATTITLTEEGATTAVGEISGRLGGAALAAGALLFGDIPSVEFEADRVELEPEGRTVLRGSVQVVWESQSLVTDELILASEAGRLRAKDEVELVAVADPAATNPDFVTVRAEDLLVEQESSEIHVSGTARLRFEELQISAERMAVLVDESGRWNRVEAVKTVQLSRPDTTATGERLEYFLDSGDMLLLGSEERPATFVYSDFEYRSTEALRVRFEEDDVVIEATEDGRTRTKVLSREGTGVGG